jgi:hypothetical protein
MNEPPDEWLERLFEFEFCPECGGDADDHEVCNVPGIGTYFARCKRSPFADTNGEDMTNDPPMITACCKFHDRDLNDIPVLNPGGWFGKTWLLELGGSYTTPLFLVVEADTISDAIDELSDNATYGHQLHVPESDLGDYPEDDRHYDASGRVIDLDHLMVHGREGCGLPYPVRYQGDGLPDEGIDPRERQDWDD